MINKYDKFILEKEISTEVINWIHLYDSKLEMQSDLKFRILKFIQNFFKKVPNDSQVKSFLSSIFKKIGKRKALLIIIVSSLIIDMGISGNLVKDSLASAGYDSSSITEIFNKDNSDKELQGFLKAMCDRESSGNWKAINRLGYIGKYQFGRLALDDCGLKHISCEKFRKDPSIFPEDLQDEAMIKLLKLNKKYLGNYYEEYVGKTINGIEMTKAGLLAASHLVGAKKVKKFLKTNGEFVPEDKNKTPCTEYMELFGKYDIDI